ncbi:CAP domain-containing protein [Trichocoleus sp. FACHB-591]|uniref:CAP domain-containing protein n=1 Tax=Trichocoleus sp. FACHB-591 TaxID=2692872 RepID=UPI001688E087|nr:CAP domain-containing protein [Trichocoleus sp. FACHB-591]MBD2098702.1 CAP domain-containing protein [Trichocoleus sp. FACHB-591]
MMRPLLTGIACSAVVMTGGLVGVFTHQNPAPAITKSLSQTAQPAHSHAQLLAQTPTTASSLTAIEKSAFDQINKYRASKRLPALTWNAAIAEQSRIHSQNMANGKVPFSHDGFQPRVAAIAKTVAYRGAAENVAYNQGFSDPATKAVQGWIKSTGHRTNIEGNYNVSGIGVAKNAKGEYYFTQVFIRSR